MSLWVKVRPGQSRIGTWTLGNPPRSVRALKRSQGVARGRHVIAPRDRSGQRGSGGHFGDLAGVPVIRSETTTGRGEKVFVEFEEEHLAISFEECVKRGTAKIALDEDTSINAAPRELQEEYELAQVSGDRED
jgi:hypothetical protein